MTTETAAIVAAGLILVVAGFQVALALGAPLGAATMGGRAPTVDGVLIPRFRLIALVSAALLVVAALIVLERGGVVALGLPAAVAAVGTWVVVVFTALNTMANLAGQHPLEKWGFSAATAAVAILALYVALTA